MPSDEPRGPGAHVLGAKHSQTQPTARDAGPLYTLAHPDMVETAAPRAVVVSQTEEPPNRCASLAIFRGELLMTRALRSYWRHGGTRRWLPGR
jgi:hypothetical protein